ncbi:hypothetical protein [Streptomyces sp. NPDC096013]|uniref:hypothetical protein n=1 Tax=Streptomyces sp. NPDC096013 TaxID=3366069 RepID=UPI00381752BA
MARHPRRTAPETHGDWSQILDRILEDQHRKLASDKSRDDFFTLFAADKALLDWDLGNGHVQFHTADRGTAQPRIALRPRSRYAGRPGISW